MNRWSGNFFSRVLSIFLIFAPVSAFAGLEGSWQGHLNLETGTHLIARATFSQGEDEAWTGTLSIFDSEPMAICDIQFDGNEVQFSVGSDWLGGETCDALDPEAVVHFQGKLSGPLLSGQANDGQMKSLWVWNSSGPEPTAVPEPTSVPTEVPEPTEAPEPTAVPTEVPEPTAIPTEIPEPTAVPTEVPEPTAVPTEIPEPTAVPTEVPEPTAAPTEVPTETPVPTTVPEPTLAPTEAPSPTQAPELAPEPTQAAQTGGGATPFEATRGFILAIRGTDPQAFVQLWNSKDRTTGAEVLVQIFENAGARNQLQQIAARLEVRLQEDTFKLEGDRARLSYPCISGDKTCLFTVVQEEGRWWIDDLD